MHVPKRRAGVDRVNEAGSAEGLVSGPDSLIAVPLRVLDCGLEDRSAVIGSDGELNLLDSTEVAILRMLERPCSPAILAERLRMEGWEGDSIAEASGMIDGLAERGLVHRLGEALEEARGALGGALSAPGPGILVLAIPTRDRPECLGRALSAWGASLARAGGAMPDVVISDDSRLDPGATRDVAEGFASTYKGSVYLLDESFRRGFATALSASAGPSAGFALGMEGVPVAGLGSYGAARNLALLASAGRTVAMADDDVLPDFRIPVDALCGIALSAEPDPFRVSTATDAAALAKRLMRPGPPDDGSESDVLGPHRSLLGRSVRDVLLETVSLDLGKADAHALDMALEPDTRIAALCFGSWGGSGTGSASYLLFSRTAVEAGGTATYSSETYAHARESGCILRAPVRATIGGKGFMCMHVAFDARTTLPPFSPFGVNEDGLWGSLLGYLQPASLIAYPGQAVSHDPRTPRVVGPGDLSRSSLALNEVMNAILGFSASRLETGWSAYEALGRRVAGLATGNRSRFRCSLAEAVSRVLGSRIASLTRARAEFGDEPELWARDIEAALERLEAKLGTPRSWLPIELSLLDSSAAEDALADYIRRFGELLQAWPAVFEHAARIAPELLGSALLPGPR